MDKSTIVSITDPQPEKRWTIRLYMYYDLLEHIQQIKSETKFWEGFQWAMAGGGISAILTVGAYHLTTTSPDAKSLLIGYIISFFLIAISVLLHARAKQSEPSFEHHKSEAIKILARIKEDNSISEMMVAENSTESVKVAGRADYDSLFTSLSIIKPFNQDGGKQ